MNIITNHNKVLNSGSVILHTFGTPISFHVEPGSGFSFDLIMDFKNDDKEQRLEIDSDVADNRIELNCFNFDNGLYTGTSKAFEIAKYENKSITMNFWSSVLGKAGNYSGRRIDYTIYIEE